jgi:endothelin-converting enzyme
VSLRTCAAPGVPTCVISSHRDILYGDPIATYNKIPVSNITSTIKQVDFPNYFASFTPRNAPVEVIVTYPDYVASLSDILDTTPHEAVEAYLVSQAALTLAPHLGVSTESWKIIRQLREVLQGIKPDAVGARSEFCINTVDQTLGFATGRYFVQETFGNASRETSMKVIQGSLALLSRP